MTGQKKIAASSWVTGFDAFLLQNIDGAIHIPGGSLAKTWTQTILQGQLIDWLFDWLILRPCANNVCIQFHFIATVTTSVLATESTMHSALSTTKSKPAASVSRITTTTSSQYECLCNYRIQTAVYPVPTKSSGALGYLHEYDCKPTYHFVSTSSRWQPIQYKQQVSEQLNCCLRENRFLLYFRNILKKSFQRYQIQIPVLQPERNVL